MIKRVTIHDFEGLRDVVVDLEPMAALVGRNKVGKSAILRALAGWARGSRAVEVEADGDPFRNFGFVGPCRSDGRAGIIVDAARTSDLLLIDDIDAGLHPVAQRDLVRMIRAKQLDSPRLQVVFETYSPYLVDGLRYEEVRVVARRAGGAVRVASLASHPEAEKWRGSMGAGEFWTFVGDSEIEPDACECGTGSERRSTTK